MRNIRKYIKHSKKNTHCIIYQLKRNVKNVSIKKDIDKIHRFIFKEENKKRRNTPSFHFPLSRSN